MMPAQRLDYIDIDRLITLRRNPQFLTPDQMEALKNSIVKDGFLVPIVVRPIEDGLFEILSGNHRFMAAREIGLPRISAVIVTPSEQSAARIAINLNTVHGDPPAETLAPFLAAMDDDTLESVHLDAELARQMTLFDSQLADRLARLEAPDKANHASAPATIPTCVCKSCGKRHAPARKASGSNSAESMNTSAAKGS